MRRHCPFACARSARTCARAGTDVSGVSTSTVTIARTCAGAYSCTCTDTGSDCYFWHLRSAVIRLCRGGSSACRWRVQLWCEACRRALHLNHSRLWLLDYDLDCYLWGWSLHIWQWINDLDDPEWPDLWGGGK